MVTIKRNGTGYNVEVTEPFDGDVPLRGCKFRAKNIDEATNAVKHYFGEPCGKNCPVCRKIAEAQSKR